MKLRIITFLMALCCIALLPGCSTVTNLSANQTQRALGGLRPDLALNYMEATKNLVIVDVVPKEMYEAKHFKGAISIPVPDKSDEELKAAFAQIPAGRPVLVHCRRGRIAPGAYRKLLVMRPDISEISYIAGVPPFDEYNRWAEKHK